MITRNVHPLVTALCLVGLSPDAAALQAQAMDALLPADHHTRTGHSAQVLLILRQRPWMLAEMIARGDLDRDRTVAAAADGGATVDELLGLMGVQIREVV